MSIESDIFKKFIPDFRRLENYGFKKKGESYYFEKKFKNNQFNAIVEITRDSKISGIVYDLTINDEYLLLRVKNSTFIDIVRKSYEEILTDIREKCFLENYFINPQANRITNIIKEKYKDIPQFLWKNNEYGVFKNSENGKWYGIIMNINRNKLEKNKTDEIEIINLKLDENKIQNLLNNNGFYPAYHMNKKNWISLVLDETLCDSVIMELVKESYGYTIDRKIH